MDWQIVNLFRIRTRSFFYFILYDNDIVKGRDVYIWKETSWVGKSLPVEQVE